MLPVGIILVVNDPLLDIRGLRIMRGYRGYPKTGMLILGTLNAANLELKHSVLAIANVDGFHPISRREGKKQTKNTKK